MYVLTPGDWPVNVGTKIRTHLCCPTFEIVPNGGGESDHGGDKWMRKAC